jgi:predicted DsbA family dithiol-disulfide isomerase
MTRLLLYHDFASPFCRVALATARAAMEGTDMTLELVPFELHPDRGPAPSQDAAVRGEVEAVQALARAVGVEVVMPPLVPSTGKAHEAVLHARAHGQAVTLASALYDALWVRGLDIGRIDVLADLGADVGLDRGALHVTLGLDVYRPEIARAQELVAGAGIDSVPAFQVGQERSVGLVPMAELRGWIDAVRGDAGK